MTSSSRPSRPLRFLPSASTTRAPRRANLLLPWRSSMSFDPYGQPDQPVDKPPVPPVQPDGTNVTNPPPPPRPPLDQAVARERVLIPGIFLILIGLLNLLSSF